MADQNLPVVFLAFANDQGDGEGYLRQLRNEAEQLRDLLEQAGQVCELVVRQNASLKNILDVFQSPKYKHRIAIFHFGGHANSYHLLLESAEGKAMPADAAGLAKFLSQQRGLHLVFLNGCATGEQAQGLLDASVKSVIATSRKISDSAAMAFAARFYEGLLSGHGEDDGLQSAFIAAEGTVQAELGQPRHAYNQPEDAAAASRTAWPWQLLPATLPPEVAAWNLAKAAKNPYFGLPELPPGRRLPQQPFLGLGYFHERHAEIFFGRGWQIRTLFQLITDETVSANPIILLYGQSGVGKSSLLAAGLLPRLKQVARVRYVRREDAGNNLTAALEKAVGSDPPSPPEGGISVQPPPFGGTGGTSEAAIVDLPAAKRDQDGPSLADCWLAQETDDRPLVIILDQVEEVITRSGDDPEQEIAQFLDVVDSIFGEAVDPWPRGKLILGFRKEWLADIEDRLNARELPYKEMFLKHLDRKGIIEAITGPATTPRLKAQYELQVADELPVVIADNLLADRGSAIAPTLQIILTRLWEGAHGKPKIFNRKLYDDLRLQPANFLGQLLDQQLTQLEARHPEENASGLVLDLLNYHTTEFGTARQHTGEALARQYSHLPEIMPALVQSCKDRYLLVDPVGDADEEAVDATRLAHDTLAPLIRYRYRDSEKPGPRAARVLQNRVPDFIRDKPGAALLDDADLSVVEAGQNGMRVWNADEQRLVEASRQARAKRQRNRRIWQGVGVVAVALIVMFAAVAGWQWQTGTYLVDVNNAGELALRAFNRLDGDPEESILLATQAVTTTYEAWGEATFQAEQALHQAVQASKVRYTLPGNTGGVWDIALSPDDTLLATVGVDQSTRLWRLALDAPSEPLSPLPNITYTAATAFHPNGNVLAVGNAAGEVQLWDVTDLPHQLRHTFQPHETWIIDLIFSPDGKTLATVSLDGKAKFFDVATRQEIIQLEFDNPLCGIDFSPDGTYVAIGGYYGVIKLWQSKTGKLTKYVHDTTGGEVCAIAFSPTRDFLLATGGSNFEAKLWELDNDQPLHTLEGHTSTIRRVAFSPDGERLSTGSFDNTAKFWVVNSGRLLSTFSGHKGFIRALAFNNNGQYLITAGGDKNDQTVKIWAAGSYHQDSGNTVTFAPDGKRLATTSYDGTVRVWSPSGRQIARYDDQAGVMWSAVFYPDNTRLAMVGEDGTLRVRDTRSGQQIISVRLTEQILYTVDINPSATLLAAGGQDNVFLLDAETGDVTISIPVEKSVFTLGFHPVKNMLAFGGEAGLVQIIHLNDNQIVHTLQHANLQTVEHLTFSSTGQYLAAASGNHLITVWEVESGQKAFEIAGHDDLVSSAKFTPDDRHLITASADQTIKIWDISDVSPGVTLDTAQLTWPQSAAINGLALSPDGSLLVTTGEDGQVRFLPLLMDIEQILKLAFTRISTRR